MLHNFFLKWARRHTGEHATTTQVKVLDKWVDLNVAIHGIRHCSNAAELIPLFSHYSGYIREAAVSQSVVFKDESIIAPLIERLNDWVPQVRLAAQNAIRANLVEENTSLLVTLLPEFAKLRNRGRDQHGFLLTEVDQFLKSPTNIRHVIEGLDSSDSKVVRECYRLLLDSDALSKAELAMFAVRSKDLLVAVEAIRMFNDLPEDVRLEGIEIGLHSPFSSLRSTMLLALLRSSSDRRQAVARSMLFDRQQTVREITCRWLSEQGEDVLKYYIDVLNGTGQPVNKIRCALWAVVKFQRLDALPMVQLLIKSSSPKVRSSAILAYAKLDPDSAEKLIDVALADEWAGTNKVAAQLVRLSGLHAPYSSLQKLLQQPDRNKIALQIARANGKWDWLLALFETILIWRESNEILFQYALSEIRIWVLLDTRGYENPTRGQADLLKVQVQRGALESCGQYRERLQFILECTGIFKK